MQDLKEMGDRFELRMGNREVAMLIGGLFVMLVVAFALGVMMGKRLYGPGGEQQAAQQAAQTTPAPASTAPPPPQEPTPSKPTPPPNTATAPAQAVTEEQYSFPDTLKNLPATSPAAHAPPATQPAASTPHAEPASPASPGLSESPAPSTSSTPPKTKPTKPSKPSPAAKPASKTEPVAEPEPTPSHHATTAASSEGTWSIQVSAVPDKKHAEDYTKSLKAKGLDAWLSSMPGTDNKTYYRVRIGHYPSYEAAKTEMQKLIEANSIPKDSFIRK